MKNITGLILTLYLFSCIDIMTTSEDDFYESVHIQGSGWFEFYQTNETESVELDNDFTFQLWFSGQNNTAIDATCIASLKGNISNISIYRNPNVKNMIMIYNGDELIQEMQLDSIDFSQNKNFYLLSIIKNNNQISLYINDQMIMADESTPLIISNEDIVKPIIGATINNNGAENLWYGYIDEIRLWNIALHDTIINFHNQYPTKVSSSYNDSYLTALNGLWNFRISMTEESFDNSFQDINDNLKYAILYTIESMTNELSQLGR